MASLTFDCKLSLFKAEAERKLKVEESLIQVISIGLTFGHAAQYLVDFLVNKTDLSIVQVQSLLQLIQSNGLIEVGILNSITLIPIPKTIQNPLKGLFGKKKKKVKKYAVKV